MQVFRVSSSCVFFLSVNILRVNQYIYLKKRLMWYKLSLFPQNGHRLPVDAWSALFCGNFFFLLGPRINIRILILLSVQIYNDDWSGSYVCSDSYLHIKQTLFNHYYPGLFSRPGYIIRDTSPVEMQVPDMAIANTPGNTICATGSYTSMFFI